MTQSALISLLEKFINESVTPDEVQQLRDFLKEPIHADYAKEWMERVLMEQRFTSYTDFDVQDMFTEVVKKSNSLTEFPTTDLKPAAKSPAHRIHFLKTTWFRYAAAIIVILGAATYLWFGTGRNQQTSLSNDEYIKMAGILPGSNKAILTLANGKQIILDNTQGNIAQQGNLKVINLNGKLDYEGVGTVAEYHTVTTPKGGQYQIVLPDGSKVWLNAASSITYPTAFINKERKVKITGEAYLEIEKDKSKPFFVDVEGSKIEVLGTNFNINAYADENAMRATLLEGSIKVIKGERAQLLQPGRQAIVNEKIQVDKNADTELVMAWKNGLFNFNQADLPTVMRQLARWYNIEVKYEGAIPARLFQGKFQKELNLSDVLVQLEQMQLKFKIEGRILTIKKPEVSRSTSGQ